MAYTNEPPMEIDMRVLRANLAGRLHDIRGMGSTHPELYDKVDYSASRALATRLRAAGSWGIVYDSVRHSGGECSAVLRPPVLTRCRQTQHLAYVWDGMSIVDMYEKRQLKL